MAEIGGVGRGEGRSQLLGWVSPQFEPDSKRRACFPTRNGDPGPWLQCNSAVMDVGVGLGDEGISSELWEKSQNWKCNLHFILFADIQHKSNASPWLAKFNAIYMQPHTSWQGLCGETDNPNLCHTALQGAECCFREGFLGKWSKGFGSVRSVDCSSKVTFPGASRIHIPQRWGWLHFRMPIYPQCLQRSWYNQGVFASCIIAVARTWTSYIS